MGKKKISWKTKGMNRDLSTSAFNPEFAFENRNLRLSTNDGNTMMSWVNERGTKELTLSIDFTPWIESHTPTETSTIIGTVLGTAVINHQLILFTHGKAESSDGAPTGPNVDRIYVLKYTASGTVNINGKVIYRGNLNFDTSYPIETAVDYESEDIQKVYWTDGLNQPRVINIAASDEKIAIWNDSTTDVEFIKLSHAIDHYFDFIPSFKSSTTLVDPNRGSYTVDTKVTITKKEDSGGLFAPGVIQYAFTYINKYCQQSNIFYISTLYYLAHSDRGASPEEKVTNSFSIEVEYPDTDFDYIRIYSIQRTSINDTPIVKLVTDISMTELTNSKVTYIDTGINGSTIDPTELLYVGGNEITALTMANKDKTLFLGNIEQKNTIVDSIQDYIDSLSEKSINFDAKKTITYKISNSLYFHTNTLNGSQQDCSYFKGGEKYRFGFQLQKSDGEWTEPIFIMDATNTKYPSTDIDQNIVSLPYATTDLNLTDIATAYNADKSSDDDKFFKVFKKIRPVVVYPTIGDRQVLCQGVLNPTVFNIEDRVSGTPFAQASWFFRPYNNGEMGTSDDPTIADTETTSTSEAPAYDYDTDLYFNNSFNECYAFVGHFTSDKLIEATLKTKILWYYYTDVDSGKTVSTKVYIEGIIEIGNGYYIFFTYTPLLRSSENRKIEWSDDFIIDFYPPLNSTGNAVSSKVYNNLMTNSLNYFYYASESGPDAYTLVTKVSSLNNTMCYYLTIFHKVSSTTNPEAVTANKGGILKFNHYDSIYTDKEADDDSEKLLNVEIQGSKNIYTTPFGGKIAARVSNSQFFIDQSIVTLNSPDLEFDTDVQNYSTDGLNLRVIGVIPITATASAHNIKASSKRDSTGTNNSSVSTHTFGTGELKTNVFYKNTSTSAFTRLVSAYLWNDVSYYSKTDDDTNEVIAATGQNLYDFMVYPWQRTGPLNNDFRDESEATSYLQYKRMSNMWFSSESIYLSGIENFTDVSVQIPLTENEEVMNYRLPAQLSGKSSEINYYSNIDKILVNTEGYYIKKTGSGGYTDDNLSTNPVSMKYKSTTHAIIVLNSMDNSTIPILPYGKYTKEGTTTSIGVWGGSSGNTFWGDNNISFTQHYLDVSSCFDNLYGFLWLGEIYKTVSNPFGGTTKSAILSNTWIPAGDTVSFTDSSTTITLNWTVGDTYYQRYDCLKTYPFTEEDPNQIIEILSFMCETHVNIDGRYDRNRGQINNLNMRPSNFNLINPVYSQKNNFFNYKKVDTENNTNLSYPNHIYYSKTKESGADVDAWTNVTLASTLELDGDKGKISSLRRFNNQLLAFQDSGIAHILYNENVQIASANGTPIELANSGKVQGKRYISDTIGCSNKWAMTQTPSGIYFIDNNNKSIYLYNGQLNNLSTSNGFNAWAKENIPSYNKGWNPENFSDFVVYYDRMNQDVLFINSETALAYSEKFGCFTSFYNYENSPYFENLDDIGLWIRDNKIWKHQAGNYNSFFGTKKPYSMTLIANQEPKVDKIFTDMEFRASIENEGVNNDSKNTFTPYTPFSTIETWDEYQHGKLTLSNNKSYMSKHGSSDGTSYINRKYRIWRCDIPRDNATVDDTTEASMGIKRFKIRPLDRMRNPWIYIKLEKNSESITGKAEIHDIDTIYFD